MPPRGKRTNRAGGEALALAGLGVIGAGAISLIFFWSRSARAAEGDGALRLFFRRPDDRPVLELDGLQVYQTGTIITWTDGDLSIDYDGAPNAYAPAGVGDPLDNLANAGHPGRWWGVETDGSGQPIVQGDDEPFPGYYRSTTALRWPGRSGAARYVDSTQISYLALPPAFQTLGAKLGDLAFVTSSQTGRSRWAIWADVGPRSKLGEGSAQLARALGVESSRLRKSGINVALFAGSGDGRPHEEEEIQQLGEQLLASFGV